MDMQYRDSYVRVAVNSETSDYDVMRQYWEAIAIGTLAHNCRHVLLELKIRTRPSLADLLLLIEDIREMGLSRMTLAIVHDEDYNSEADRFAETAAFNRGIRWRSFTSIDAAVRWLDGIG
jgi:hypothetical protein